jgi:hypothetical protein
MKTENKTAAATGAVASPARGGCRCDPCACRDCGCN